MSTKLYYERMESLDGLPVYSVGWLGDTIPRSGKVNAEVIDRLRLCSRTNSQHDVFGARFGSWGDHVCEICANCSEHGEILVSSATAHYLLPKMVFHYMEAHDYLPPEEFLIDLQKLPKSQ